MDTHLMSLIERVSALTGPDRGVEVSIWRALDGGVAGREPLPWLNCYTESVDAALALVERVLPGAEVMLRTYPWRPERYSWVAPDREMPPFEAWATTAPLAIILALLRALESTTPNTEGKSNG